MTTTTLDTYIREGRLIRKAWTGADAEGRHTACLLAALAPICGEHKDSSVCPADVMPPWLAHLTPWMDDSGTEAVWPGMVRRYAAVASRWHVLTPASWQRAEWLVRIACVEEALSHVTTDECGVRAACERLIAVLRRAVDTGTLDEVAARATQETGAWVRSAVAGVVAVAQVEAAAAGETMGVEEQASDRITTRILEILESECDQMEAA